MADNFANNADSVFAPARQIFLITPHATNALSTIPKAIRADSAGTVALRAVGSSADVTVTMAAGEVLAVRAEYVRVTGTTVATLHGLA